MTDNPPRVAILMGSHSDWGAMQHAGATLDALGIANESRVISAHRQAARLDEYLGGIEDAGVQVVIAGAGMAAALPGVVASRVRIPVLGVPMEGKLSSLDSLLSIVQMPAGIPVGTLAVGRAGAINAALLAAAILALSDAEIGRRLTEYRRAQADQPEIPGET